MPVAVHICPTQMSEDDYQRLIGELEASGAAEPEGQLYHAAFGEEDLEIFEVWESAEHFDAHRDRTYALLQGAGVDAGLGRARIEQLHSKHPD
jgi:quinol monooxygenase YgiN